jgi:hypothetical protein
VSSESLDVPEACPTTPVLPGISANGGICMRACSCLSVPRAIATVSNPIRRANCTPR